ncbi:MAG: PKD domain-containing protein [Bacteroidota bacterium]
MKRYFFLFVWTTLFMAASCEMDDDLPPPQPQRPVANFSKSPLVVIADKTRVQFEDLSTGSIDKYDWDFEDGLGRSSAKEPTYTFEYEGARPVELKVEGDGGTDSKTLLLVVHPFDPNCTNFENASTHSVRQIDRLRENGLVKDGTVTIRNNYGVSIDFLFYHPENWINGKYTYYYKSTLPSGFSYTLNIDNSDILLSNEWGVRAQSTNGAISCIRTLGSIARFSGNNYEIFASDIFDCL